MKKVFILTILLFAFATVYSQNLDSLFTVFSASRGEKQIIAANEIVKYAYENDCIDSLITLKTSDRKEFVDATVYDAMGGYYMLEKTNYEKSIEFYRLAIEYYETIGDAVAVNKINGSIGANYARMGDYENAVAYTLKRYERAKSEGDSDGLSSMLNNLGIMYSQWQKHDMAIRYFEEAINVERPLNRPMEYATRLASLAKEYSFTDAKRALPLIKEALEYDEKIEPQALKEERIAVHLVQMGDVYRVLDSLEIAEKCYQTSLAFFEKNGRTYNVAFTLLAVGHLQLMAKQYGDAVATLQKCEKIAEDNKYLRVQRDACNLLHEAYSKLEPHTMSYHYLKKYTALNDSIFRETSQQHINEFQVKYETAKKQLEIERKQTEINRYKTRQMLSFGGLLAAVLLVGLLTYIVKLRNRRNRLLAETNATKDKFFSIISHDLKNPAVAQRDAIQLLSDNSANWDTASLSRFHEKLLQSAKGQVELLYTLLDWAQLQTGRMTFQPAPFDLTAILQPDISIIREMADSKGITFDVLIPAEAVIPCDKNMLTTVVRNLLNNAVKYTSKGGTVTLNISPGAGASTYTISVADTGTGMTAEQLQTLFRLDKPQSRRGTAGEQGSGLGLIVCREMLQKHGSTLHVESETGKGSRFWFEIGKI
jgi:signal transduction histidine kinase/Flp pilus assembly protein TadD